MIEVTTKHHEPVEQATVLRSDFDFVIQDKQRGVKLIQEVYALLVDDKSIEAKELLQKRVNNMNVDIDHRNGIRNDNRIVNLRRATDAENSYITGSLKPTALPAWQKGGGLK